MTRREFLKLTVLGIALSLLKPFEVAETFYRPAEGFDFSPKPKGRVFKFHPPLGEVVRHRRFPTVEIERF